MSISLYRLYAADCIALAKSVVVKSEMDADAINAHLEEMGHEVDEQLPETWKYYMHLAGDYHATDSLMTVTSLDTLEPIAFTRANMDVHRATRAAYLEHGDYYERLVARYPMQESLIDGILKPIPYTVSITAKNWSILDYDRSLVEENELNLINDLGEAVRVFARRWVNAPYTLTDNLYPALVRGMLAGLILLPGIINIRKKYCKTEQAHSYHIREYLASHGGLDVHLSLMTRKQALFLYRNILYLQNNAGKQEIFSLLVDRIMTDRSLPLASYTLRHNLSRMPEDLPDEGFVYFPDVEMDREPLNERGVGTGTDQRTVREVLEKGIKEGLLNEAYLNENEEDAVRKMKYGPYNELPTKVLESAVIDRYDSKVFKLPDIRLNNWIYLACIGRYTAFISFTHPVTAETIQLNPKDAFLLYLLAFNRQLKADRDDFDYVPESIAAGLVRREVLPSIEDVMSIVPEKYVSREQVQYVRDNIPPLGQYINVQSFHSYVLETHRTMNHFSDIYSSQEDMYVRGYLEAATLHHYQDIGLELSEPDVLYSDWLASKSIDLTGVDEEGYRLIADELLRKATGSDLAVNVTLRDVQTAMITIMRRLSSYSVQYIQSVNEDSVYVHDWMGLRLGNPRLELEDHWLLDMKFVRVKNARVYSRVGTVEMLSNPTPVEPVLKRSFYFRVPIAAKLGVKAAIKYRTQVDLNVVRFYTREDDRTPLSEALPLGNYPEYTYPTP